MSTEGEPGQPSAANQQNASQAQDQQNHRKGQKKQGDQSPLTAVLQQQILDAMDPVLQIFTDRLVASSRLFRRHLRDSM